MPISIGSKTQESLPLILCCPNKVLARLYIENGASTLNINFELCLEIFSSSDVNIMFLEFLIRECGLDIDELDSDNKTCLMKCAE